MWIFLQEEELYTSDLYSLVLSLLDLTQTKIFENFALSRHHIKALHPAPNSTNKQANQTNPVPKQALKPTNQTTNQSNNQPIKLPTNQMAN